MKNTNLVFVLKNTDQIFMKNTNLIFVLKFTDKIYIKSIDLVFFILNIDWIYMKRHRFGFCFEKHRLDLYEKAQVQSFQKKNIMKLL